MTEMILDARTLPEPLFKLVNSDRVRVSEAGGVITMSPVEEGIESVKKARGCLKGGNLTVDKFLEWTRDDKELEV